MQNLWTSGFIFTTSYHKKDGNNFGLYRDDGLGVIKATARDIENIKKDLCSIFNKYGLKITIEANVKKTVNFLDVRLNLSTGKNQPYSQPNNLPLYVHKKYNHPPNILRNIPLFVNKRLTEISSDEESFQWASQQYQQAIQNSGYTHQLKYKHSVFFRIFSWVLFAEKIEFSWTAVVVATPPPPYWGADTCTQ